MSLSDNPLESEQELRWRAWQGKSRRSDQLTEKRMKIVFSVIVAALLLAVLYYWLRAEAQPKVTQPIVAASHGSAPRLADGLLTAD
jgi:hypothetical protein